MTTYESDIELPIGQVPNALNFEELDIELLDIHNSLEALAGELMNTDFLTEIKKGNIPGHTLISLIGRNPAIGAAFEDMWGPGGVQVLATGAESWEMVCASANDTAAGSGAQEVTLVYLDDSYAEQIVTVATNGGTQSFSISDGFRLQSAQVTAVGSTKYNEGDITIQVTGGGAVRGLIPFISGDRGFCISHDIHYTVPAGKMAFTVDIVSSYPKGTDGYARPIISVEGGPEVIGAELPFYQTGTQLEVHAPFPLVEKSDLSFQANSLSGTAKLNISISLLIVDSNLTQQA